MAWSDNGDGTWELSVTLTAPDVVKDMFEQIRAMINYRFFTTATAMTSEEFVEFLVVGKMTDRQDTELKGKTINAPYSFRRMWVEFKKMFVSRYTRTDVSSDEGDTEALAFSVPAPPAP